MIGLIYDPTSMSIPNQNKKHIPGRLQVTGNNDLIYIDNIILFLRRQEYSYIYEHYFIIYNSFYFKYISYIFPSKLLELSPYVDLVGAQRHISSK